MVARNEVGIDPRRPLDYVGAEFSFLPCYQAPRRPKVTDFRNLFSLWRVGTNSPSQTLLNGVAGELWYLSYYNSTGQAIWLMLSSGTSGPVVKFPVPNGTSPVVSDGLGNVTLTSTLGTITITGGLSTINFDLAGGATAIEKITVDHADAPGTNPVVPVAGIISILGATVVAQSIPVRTESDAANTIHIQNQLTSTSTSGAKTINNAGLSSFNSAQFTEDAPTGFISIKGGTGPVLQTITGDDTTIVSPDASGNIVLQGLVVANATHAKAVFTESPGVNVEKIDIQVSAAIAATDITKVGLSAFKSTQFTVDANGFVSITNFSPFIYTQINNASSPYTVLSTDNYISCDPTAGTISILLPNAPTIYRQFIIKDRTGMASTNNISITTVGGVVTIDTLTTYKIVGNFGSINLLFNGTSYEVY